MKNIHIIRTDELIKKRGDLVQDKFGTIHIFTIKDGDEYGKTTTKLQMYITSNEEIKRNDYYIHNNRVSQSAGGEQEKGDYRNCKKIILTTDSTLIKDGVQKIPSVFLEWFITNPSCEFVEVERNHPVMIGTPNRLVGNYDFKCYHCGTVENMIGSKSDTLCYKCLVYKIMIPQEFNLENISSTELSPDYQQFINDNWDYLMGTDDVKNEIRYSESEVRELLIKALTHDDYMFCGSLVTKDNEIRTANFNIWFEEYKKK